MERALAHVTIMDYFWDPWQGQVSSPLSYSRAPGPSSWRVGTGRPSADAVQEELCSTARTPQRMSEVRVGSARRHARNARRGAWGSSAWGGGGHTPRSRQVQVGSSSTLARSRGVPTELQSPSPPLGVGGRRKEEGRHGVRALVHVWDLLETRHTALRVIHFDLWSGAAPGVVWRSRGVRRVSPAGQGLFGEGVAGSPRVRAARAGGGLSVPSVQPPLDRAAWVTMCRPRWLPLFPPGLAACPQHRALRVIEHSPRP